VQPINRPPLAVRFLRFIVIGGATGAVYVGVAVFLRWVGVGVDIATGSAVVISALVSYAGNHSWTFEVSGNHAHHLPRFALVVAAGIAVNQLLVFAFVDWLGWSYLSVLAAFLIAIPLLNFAVHNAYSFSDPNR
jgi:putative flippase GtrA